MPLSNKDRSRLNRAMKAASLSTARQRHGAVIYRAGSLVSVGINVVKNDPYYIGDAARRPENHAEVMAIRAAGQDDLSGCTIYVARINKKDDPMMSAPCPTCQEALKKAGIRKIYYTIDNEMEL